MFSTRSGIALVSGGTGGIGRAIVSELAASGADVAFTYRANNAAAETLLDEIRATGATAAAVPLDLLDPEACRAMVDELLDQHGAIHTVVHAAGPHVPMRHLSAIAPSDFSAQIGADLLGFHHLIHPLIPALRASRGSVVAVTSAATSRYPKRDSLSSIPKAGVDAMVRALAAEEGRYDVRYNSVGPGMLTDGMADRLISSGDLDEAALEITRRNIPLARFGTALDIAHAVVFLASDKANFITGQKLDVDGGYTV